jgi:hypothetical protein
MLSSQRLIWSRDDNETPEEHLANEDSKAAVQWKAGVGIDIRFIDQHLICSGKMSQRAGKCHTTVQGGGVQAVALAPRSCG